MMEADTRSSAGSRIAMRALLHLIATLLCLALPAAAQQAVTATDADSAQTDRSATGGAQTLEDILRRQQGLSVDDSFRRSVLGDGGAADMTRQLGALGGKSDPEVWRALRYGHDSVRVSAGGDPARVLIQDGGMAWLQFREGPLPKWGGYAMLSMFGVLVLFYLLRGRMRVDGKPTGRQIKRFSSVERFAHWLFAGAFLLLGVTGLVSIFGRAHLIPFMGKDGYAALAAASKWVHSNVAWAFMLGLAMVTILWVAHNIPKRDDLKWLAVGGGMFSKGIHPPAHKFNAGEKILFWICVLFGISISLSGLSLLFPFELPMFAKTFAVLNQTGVPQLVGLGELPTELAPHQEMQFSQAWHAIVSFAFMTVIIGHMYLGSFGMEGAFDAMNSGEVGEQWAREHHGLWVRKLEEEGRLAPHGAPAPAE